MLSSSVNFANPFLTLLFVLFLSSFSLSPIRSHLRGDCCGYEIGVVRMSEIN
jgi:hypothetical protein